MFKLPFGWLPGHWGLQGRTREIAQAEYELSKDSVGLKYRLLEIHRDDYTPDEYNKKVWELDFATGKLTKGDYKRNLASLIEDETRRNLALLDVDFEEKKIGELEYQKQGCSIRKEPWVTVIDMDFNKANPQEGSFELDWNEYFVQHLKEKGYRGATDDQIVNQWFIELCSNVAMEEFTNAEGFEPDPEANLEAFKRWSTNTTKEKIDDKRKGYR